MENYDKISSEEYWNEDYLGDFNFFLNLLPTLKKAEASPH